MEKQEQQDSIDLKLFHNPSDQMHVDMKTCPISNLHSKEIGSAGKALRVRKPYTITKQRERWTEEEHKKFLEAVQLYGRAWRQIEEYIGSKTTVQIRSHAQKFFSKVINQTGTTENMEIPPPRPKKKPAHPYPRKLGNLSTKGARAKQFEKPPLLISAICEQDNGSLTSVLLAGGSEAPGCSSLVASAADSSDQDDAGQSLDVEAEEDHKLPYDGSPAPWITIQNQPQMDIDQRSAVHNSSEAQVTTLKLFGKMLMVTDSNKPSAPCTGNEAEPAQASSSHRVDNREEKAFKLRFKPEMSLQSHTQAGNACPGGGVRPAIDCLPFVGDNSVEPTTFLRPWWAMCGNIFSPFINSKPQYPLQPSTEPVRREGPWTGSNTAASCVVDDTDGAFCSKAGNLDENVQMHCSILKAIRTPVSKSWTGASETGFIIPWRSCAAESEVHHSATVGEDGENQAVWARNSYERWPPIFSDEQDYDDYEEI